MRGDGGSTCGQAVQAHRIWTRGMGAPQVQAKFKELIGARSIRSSSMNNSFRYAFTNGSQSSLSGYRQITIHPHESAKSPV